MASQEPLHLSCCLLRCSGYFYGSWHVPQVKVTDVTRRCCMFSLAGPRAAGLLEGLGAKGLLAGAQHAHAVFACAGAPVLAAAGSGLGPAFPGATLVADEAVAAELWARLLEEVGTRPGAGALGRSPMAQAAAHVFHC